MKGSGLNNNTRASTGCWWNVKYLDEARSCRDLSVEVLLPLFLLHLQGKARA